MMSSFVENLSGQWLVFFKGKQSGHGLLSFNTFGHPGGYLSLYQDENSGEDTPFLLLQGRVAVHEVSSCVFKATARKINSQTPGEVAFEGRREVDSLSNQWTGSWHSTAGYQGMFEMTKLHARPFERDNIPLIKNWNEFSDWAFSQDAESSVYRGLGDSRYSLVSTAHRSGIFDLHHYLVEILPRVRAELLKRHGLRIDISAPDGLAEILALIRHHGFPSPIMDWSKSPWVALYFAISNARAQSKNGKDLACCRVYCLNHDGISVVADVQKALLMPNLGGPFAEIPTPMTSRVTAQEGIFLLTPCVDVLTTFMHQEKKNSKLVVSAIDINVGVIDEFLARLDRMMINEATMLSSIDSTLNHLKEKLIR